MWSFGCIVAELFLGLPLFPGASEFDLLKRMIKILGYAVQYLKRPYFQFDGALCTCTFIYFKIIAASSITMLIIAVVYKSSHLNSLQYLLVSLTFLRSSSTIFN